MRYTLSSLYIYIYIYIYFFATVFLHKKDTGSQVFSQIIYVFLFVTLNSYTRILFIPSAG